jgi:hypothetical protein
MIDDAAPAEQSAGACRLAKFFQRTSAATRTREGLV